MSEIERHEDESARAFDKRLAWRLLRYLRPYRGTAALAVGLIIVQALLQVAGPLIMAVAIDLFVVPPGGDVQIGVSDQIGDWLSGLGWNLDPLTGINVAALLYLASVGSGFGILYIQMVVMNMMGQYVQYDLRREIFAHLQRLDVRFFDRNPVGRLVTRATTDVEALNEMFTAGFVAIFGDIFVLAGIVGILFWMNWQLALVLFSILPFILILSIWFRRGARRTYRQVRVRLAAMNAFLQEHFSGMPIVQIFNRQREESAKFSELNGRHRDANIDSIKYYAVFYPGVDLIQSVGIALIVWWGGGQVIQSTLSLGALVAFFQYAQRFYEPISDLSEKYNILQGAMAASERIFKLLDTRIDVPLRHSGRDLIPRADEIEFRNVWFAYNDENWVLKGVSFRVGRGERVALVGHTGAGKTTVTNLLLRFYDIQRGEILINGIDIRQIDLAELRGLFAIVQQDVFLFSGSIGDNISLGDRSISADRIRKAAERVRADKFISRLPQTYGSELRERGGGLSSGERQLLSFARALAFDPTVLVLDEATSSIDTETERLIQEGAEELMKDRTSIVIAHRLSTIRSANAILVFHHGEIRERGTHEELLAAGGLYQRLYELQYEEQASALEEVG